MKPNGRFRRCSVDNHEPAGWFAFAVYLFSAAYFIGSLLYMVGASILG